MLLLQSIELVQCILMRLSGSTWHKTISASSKMSSKILRKQWIIEHSMLLLQSIELVQCILMRLSGQTLHIEQTSRFTNEFINIPLSGYFTHYTFFVIISQTSRKFIIVHRGSIFHFTPPAGYFFRI